MGCREARLHLVFFALCISASSRVKILHFDVCLIGYLVLWIVLPQQQLLLQVFSRFITITTAPQST